MLKVYGLSYTNKNVGICQTDIGCAVHTCQADHCTTMCGTYCNTQCPQQCYQCSANGGCHGNCIIH
ncbi:MAG: hypothetical protein NTX05_00090 [Fusobacteria bacterium]|nr:hypothetical protein [Fusobacteriota bacterium]